MLSESREKKLSIPETRQAQSVKLWLRAPGGFRSQGKAAEAKAIKGTTQEAGIPQFLKQFECSHLMRPCKAIRAHITISSLHLPCLTDKRTGWFVLSGKMPFLYAATQVKSNMLLCFFFFELRRHMELENLAAPFYSAHK